MLKNELDIASDILGILQNVQGDEDAKEFVRIYTEAIENERKQMRLKLIDIALVFKHISEVDSRIEP